MKYVTKKMVMVINRLVTEISGGAKSDGDYIRPGQNLGFVDVIHKNVVFGEVIYPDIYSMAGAYMFYIIKNHIFLDGNKRTGLAAAVSFLEINGVYLAPFDEDSVFDFVIGIAAGENDPEIVIPKIAEWFKSVSLA